MLKVTLSVSPAGRSFYQQVQAVFRHIKPVNAVSVFIHTGQEEQAVFKIGRLGNPGEGVRVKGLRHSALGVWQLPEGALVLRDGGAILRVRRPGLVHFFFAEGAQIFVVFVQQYHTAQIVRGQVKTGKRALIHQGISFLAVGAINRLRVQPKFPIGVFYGTGDLLGKEGFIGFYRLRGERRGGGGGRCGRLRPGGSGNGWGGFGPGSGFRRSGRTAGKQ